MWRDRLAVLAINAEIVALYPLSASVSRMKPGWTVVEPVLSSHIYVVSLLFLGSPIKRCVFPFKIDYWSPLSI